MNYSSCKSSIRQLLPVSFAVLALIATGCKPASDPNTAETKSLDNFAKEDGTNLTENTCGIVYTGSEKLPDYVDTYKNRIKGATEFKNTAIGVMTAVPENLMGAFFSLKGTVLISSKSESLCQGNTKSPEEKNLGGKSIPACWRQSAPGLPPEIVLPENHAQIRHSLLRLFSYAFAEAFVENIGKTESGSFATTEAKDAAKGFLAERDNIARLFLKDLNKLKRPEVSAKMSTFNQKNPGKFGNYVYAEAIDSYYCSSKSRGTFKKMFRSTWNRFTDSGLANSPVKLFGTR